MMLAPSRSPILIKLISVLSMFAISSPTPLLVDGHLTPITAVLDSDEWVLPFLVFPSTSYRHPSPYVPDPKDGAETQTDELAGRVCACETLSRTLSPNAHLRYLESNRCVNPGEAVKLLDGMEDIPWLGRDPSFRQEVYSLRRQLDEAEPGEKERREWIPRPVPLTSAASLRLICRAHRLVRIRDWIQTVSEKQRSAVLANLTATAANLPAKLQHGLNSTIAAAAARLRAVVVDIRRTLWRPPLSVADWLARLNDDIRMFEELAERIACLRRRFEQTGDWLPELDSLEAEQAESAPASRRSLAEVDAMRGRLGAQLEEVGACSWGRGDRARLWRDFGVLKRQLDLDWMIARIREEGVGQERPAGVEGLVNNRTALIEELRNEMLPSLLREVAARPQACLGVDNASASVVNSSGEHERHDGAVVRDRRNRGTTRTNRSGRTTAGRSSRRRTKSRRKVGRGKAENFGRNRTIQNRSDHVCPQKDEENLRSSQGGGPSTSFFAENSSFVRDLRHWLKDAVRGEIELVNDQLDKLMTSRIGSTWTCTVRFARHYWLLPDGKQWAGPVELGAESIVKCSEGRGTTIFMYLTHRSSP